MSEQTHPLSCDGESRYNARKSVPEHTEIFARWASDSIKVRERAQQQATCRLDVPYGTDESETLDLFLPDGPVKGTLMYIHGGYWSSLDKSDASLVAPGFTKAGYAVAVVNYALCPAVTIGVIVDQIRAAAAWLYQHGSDWGSPPHALFSCGHSAGGHLATMLLSTDWPTLQPQLPVRTVAGAISISGLYDLRPLLEVPTLMRLINLAPEDAKALSPALCTPRSGAPLLTALGTDENQGFKDQANIIARRWASNHVAQVDCVGRNHFTVLDDLISSQGNILKAALQFMSSQVERTS